jgi:hypothetical protein
VLPNVLGPVLVIATVNLSLAIITEATLSFLGVGVPVTHPSLGTLIRIGNDYLMSGEWWIAIFPGLALVFCASGHVGNLRPDRLFGTIWALGPKYIVIVALGALAVLGGAAYLASASALALTLALALALRFALGVVHRARGAAQEVPRLPAPAAPARGGVARGGAKLLQERARVRAGGEARRGGGALLGAAAGASARQGRRVKAQCSHALGLHLVLVSRLGEAAGASARQSRR